VKTKIIVTTLVIVTLGAVLIFRDFFRKKEMITSIKSFNGIDITKLDFSRETQRLVHKNVSYEIKITIEKNLQNFIKNEISKFKPYYASVVVINNQNGEILSAVGYSGENREFNDYLSFSSTHPSASLIKIVTAADLIENSHFSSDKEVSFLGRATTLYKYQLKRSGGRELTFGEAFARSNNPVFASSALKFSSEKRLLEMANKFGFNRDIVLDVDVKPSSISNAKDDFNFAELASGFTTETMISPLHGALFSMVVARNGTLVRPHLVREYQEIGTDAPEYVNSPVERVISDKTAEEMAQIMNLTLEKGTARKVFRTMSKKLKSELLMGGKTGSITGGLPYGKRDWFTAFAKPKKLKNQGISVCVMIVNDEKWIVRSSFLARRVIEYYFSREFNLALKTTDRSKIIKYYGNQPKSNKRS